MANQQIKCSDCDYVYMEAKSKRINPCPNCEHLERHGISLVDAKKKKQQQQQQASRKRTEEKMRLKPPKNYAIPKFSKKGKVQANRMAAMKNELKHAHTEGQEYGQCEGCLQFFKGLDASHKVPLSQSIALASEPENIRLLCRECHNKWEHGTVHQIIQLECFEEDMLYLLDMDPERFWKIYYRMETQWLSDQNPTILDIMNRLSEASER